jgi:hypothetical protein
MGAYCGSVLVSGGGGPICSRADPLFRAKKHPLNRKNWIPTYRVPPPGDYSGYKKNWPQAVTMGTLD